MLLLDADAYLGSMMCLEPGDTGLYGMYHWQLPSPTDLPDGIPAIGSRLPNNQTQPLK